MLDIERDANSTRQATHADRPPAAEPVASIDPGSLAPPRPADQLDGLLARAILRRQTGTAEDEARVVEGADGEVELKPLTLGDFLYVAVVERQRRDRRGRKRQAKAERAGADNEQAKLKAAEQARLEAEEKKRLEDAEKERLRLEAAETERLRLEAEEKERVRLEAEAKQKAKVEAEEKKRAEELAQWKAGLKQIALELAAEVEATIGPTLWAVLDAGEKTEAVREALELADQPITSKSGILHRLNQANKKRKNKLPVDLAAVFADIKASGRAAALQVAGKFKGIAQTRKLEAEQAAADALALAVVPSPAELTDLWKSKPTGNMLKVLYRALHHGKIRFIHADTYRTKHEQKEKAGQQHGPFSREFHVRVRGSRTDKPAHWEERGAWVVHVHYKSSATPRVAEYLHIKSWQERKVPINHVINKKLEATLDAPTDAVIQASVDKDMNIV